MFALQLSDGGHFQRADFPHAKAGRQHTWRFHGSAFPFKGKEDAASGEGAKAIGDAMQLPYSRKHLAWAAGLAKRPVGSRRDAGIRLGVNRNYRCNTAVQPARQAKRVPALPATRC